MIGKKGFQCKKLLKLLRELFELRGKGGGVQGLNEGDRADVAKMTEEHGDNVKQNPTNHGIENQNEMRGAGDLAYSYSMLPRRQVRRKRGNGNSVMEMKPKNKYAISHISKDEVSGSRFSALGDLNRGVGLVHLLSIYIIYLLPKYQFYPFFN